MWFRNKEVEKKPEQVKCEVCKHWVDKSGCQIVKENFIFITSRGSITSSNFSEVFYCPIHNVPYSRKAGESYYRTIPEHEIEVDKNGKPIQRSKSAV